MGGLAVGRVVDIGAGEELVDNNLHLVVVEHLPSGLSV